MSLRLTHRTPDSLTEAELHRMFSLMSAHYRGTSHPRFLSDLSHKEGVLLVLDEYDVVQGFTTYVVWDTELDTKPVRFLFSGDTILDQSKWGQSIAFDALGLLVSMLLQTNKQSYWLLLSKGHRTYLLLPLFFTVFYPSYTTVGNPELARLRAQAGQRFFDTLYLPDLGVVRPFADALKPELGVVSENKQQKNPHVSFFLANNPAYLSGDELVCIAPVSLSNLTDFGLRCTRKMGFANPE